MQLYKNLSFDLLPIRSGNAEFNLNGQDAEEYPQMNFPFCESIGAGVLIPFVDINFITSNSFNKFSFLCFLVSKNLITMFLSWLRKTLSSNPPRSSSLSESTPYTFSDCLTGVNPTLKDGKLNFTATDKEMSHELMR